MPLIVAEEKRVQGGTRGKRTSCTLIAHGSASLSPPYFRGRRTRRPILPKARPTSPNTEAFNPRGVLLHRLHLALEDYWHAPEGLQFGH